jgi:hypothetical protein
MFLLDLIDWFLSGEEFGTFPIGAVKRFNPLGSAHL